MHFHAVSQDYFLFPPFCLHLPMHARCFSMLLSLFILLIHTFHFPCLSLKVFAVKHEGVS
jgi:hypothetical protein